GEDRRVRDGVARVLVRRAGDGDALEMGLQTSGQLIDVADGRRLADVPREFPGGVVCVHDERELSGLPFGAAARRDLSKARHDDLIERRDRAALLALLRLTVVRLAREDRALEHVDLWGSRGSAR